APERVLLDALALGRADVPRELLELGHHRALVAGLLGEPVRPPLLAALEQAEVAFRARHPDELPEPARLAIPDRAGVPAEPGRQLGEVRVPHRVARALPCLAERALRRLRGRGRIRPAGERHGELVGERAEPGWRAAALD